MRLVWSQPTAPDRPRRVLLLAVVCIFLGGLVGGRGDLPRPFRAAAASLFATGSLFFLTGAAGLALRKKRGNARRLSLAPSGHDTTQQESLTALREEEQR